MRTVWKLAVLGPLLLGLSACGEDDDKTSAFQVDPKPDTKSFISSTGFSAVIQANAPKGSQSSDIGAQLYFDANLTVVDGGDVFVVRNESEKTLLNKFGQGDTEYAGTLTIADISKGLSFTMEHLPVESRQDRWYPVELAYVATNPGTFVGLDFSAQYPQTITATKPSNGSSFQSAATEITLEWADAADSEQVEVSAFAHCTNELKVVYRGDWTARSGTQNTVGITIEDILKQPSKEDPFLDNFLTTFVLDLVTFGFFSRNREKPSTINECDIDLVFSGLKYQALGTGGATGTDPQLKGGLSIMSSSETVRIAFRPLTPYAL